MNYARAAAGALLLLLFATFDAVAIQTHFEVVKLGAYALASVTGTALVYLTGWKVPGPGQVVVDEADLLELSRTVRGHYQGLRDRFRFGEVAAHALGRIRSTLGLIAWKAEGSPFPNRRTELELLETAFGEDLPGYALHWPHALDDLHGNKKERRS